MKKKQTEQNDALIEIRFLEGVNRRLADHESTLKALGDLYTRSGFVDKGLDTDLKLVALCPDDPMVWYNLGCSYALSGKAERAFDALNRAVELGYADRNWMMEDEDLQTLRKDLRFEHLLFRMTGDNQEPAGE